MIKDFRRLVADPETPAEVWGFLEDFVLTAISLMHSDRMSSLPSGFTGPFLSRGISNPSLTMSGLLPCWKVQQNKDHPFAWFSPGELLEHLVLFWREQSPLPDRRGRSEWRGFLLTFVCSYYIGNKNKLSGLSLAKASLAPIQGVTEAVILVFFTHFWACAAFQHCPTTSVINEQRTLAY